MLTAPIIDLPMVCEEMDVPKSQGRIMVGDMNSRQAAGCCADSNSAMEIVCDREHDYSRQLPLHELEVFPRLLTGTPVHSLYQAKSIDF